MPVANAKNRRRGGCSTWPPRAPAKSCISSRGRSSKPRRTARCIRLSPTEACLKLRGPALREQRFSAALTTGAPLKLLKPHRLANRKSSIPSPPRRENLLAMPAPPDASRPRRRRLRRLPPDYRPALCRISHPQPRSRWLGAGRLYERHEGGLLSRALGKAVHELFQHLAQLLATQTR